MCGFHKDLSTHHCFLALLEKWKRETDNGETFGDLLTDLSRTFDCLDHECSIAKLNGYEFSLPALKSIHDYRNRKQTTKINFSFNEELEGSSYSLNSFIHKEAFWIYFSSTFF